MDFHQGVLYNGLKGALPGCPCRVPSKGVLEGCPARLFMHGVLPGCPRGVSQGVSCGVFSGMSSGESCGVSSEVSCMMSYRMSIFCLRFSRLNFDTIDILCRVTPTGLCIELKQ
jgi:hypothetical protein